MADGSVILDVNLDVSKADKELSKLKKSIQDTEERVNKLGEKKAPLVKQAEELRGKISEARAEVEKFGQQWVDGVIGADKKQVEAQTRLAQLQREYDGVAQKIDKIDKKLIPALDDLDGMKERAGALQQEIESAAQSTNHLKKATALAEKYMDKFTKRVTGLMKRVFVFTVITSALRSLKEWLWESIKTNEEAVSAVSKLKGALLTLAQPLVDVVIPAFTQLVSVLTKIVSTIAQLVAYVFGKTGEEASKAAQALYEEKKALEGTAEAAEDTAKSLAGFDEINKLAGQTDTNEAETTTIQPSFELDMDMTETQLKTLLGLVTSIAIALASWKLSSVLGGGFTNLLGSLSTIAGAVIFVQGIFDAWVNGVTWENLQKSIFGITLAAVGLNALFGPIAAGIAILVAGIMMLVTGFKDAMESGFNLENTMMSLTGIITAGLGISVLTGSLIPALIAGIAAILLAITVATGHGEELLAGVRQMLNGFVEFFKGIFTGDIERAIGGLSDIFGGLKTAVNAIISGVKDLFLGFFDWLDEKTGGRLHGIITFFKGLFAGAFDFISEVISAAIDTIYQVLGGVITFLAGVFTADFDKAWEGIKQIFVGVWNGIISTLESAVNLIIKGINYLINQLNKVSFDIPDWVPAIGGKSFGFSIKNIGSISIPRLATGGVVPPNREFLAVLGDNKQEPEIVSPRSMMKQVMLEALRESGGGTGETVVVLELDGREFGRAVYKANKQESSRIGVSLVGV